MKNLLPHTWYLDLPTSFFLLLFPQLNFWKSRLISQIHTQKCITPSSSQTSRVSILRPSRPIRVCIRWAVDVWIFRSIIARSIILHSCQKNQYLMNSAEHSESLSTKFVLMPYRRWCHHNWGRERPHRSKTTKKVIKACNCARVIHQGRSQALESQL